MHCMLHGYRFVIDEVLMEKYKKMVALLTPTQAEFLDKKKEEGYTKVEIIRRALDQYMEKQPELPAAQAAK